MLFICTPIEYHTELFTVLDSRIGAEFVSAIFAASISFALVASVLFIDGERFPSGGRSRAFENWGPNGFMRIPSVIMIEVSFLL